MKGECADNLRQMREERRENDDFKRQFRELRESLSKQDLKKEVEEVKERGQRHSAYFKQCLEAVVLDVKGFKMSARERRADLEAKVEELAAILKGRGGEGEKEGASLGEQLKDLREETGKVGEEYERMTEVGREVLQRVSALEVGAASTAGLARDVPLIKEALKELVEETEAQLKEHSEAVREASEAASALVRESVTKASREQEALRARLESDARRAREELVAAQAAELRRVSRALSSAWERMDELDSMHDDMQDRVREIDRARRNNLVFYGVRSAEDEGGEECVAHIRKIFNTYLQVENMFQSDFFF